METKLTKTNEDFQKVVEDIKALAPSSVTDSKDEETKVNKSMEEIKCPYCGSEGILEDDMLVTGTGEGDIEAEYTEYYCMDCNKRF